MHSHLKNLPDRPARCAVVGAGPAGLMAAQVLAEGGATVDVFDRMPTAGRKFLLAGKGGLNLTHSEHFDTFVARYGARSAEMAPLLRAMPPTRLREWAAGLGVETFVGSSGRIFPREMKAAPLLRAWLRRLRGLGVRFHMRHRWKGSVAVDELRFDTPDGELSHRSDALVLALGGGSWPRLGSDGSWVEPLSTMGIDVAPLQPSNCGFEVAQGWSGHFRERFAGHALKSVALSIGAPVSWRQTGEFIVTDYGIEGSLVYAASALLREHIDARGSAEGVLDLLPARDTQWVAEQVAHPRGSRSMSTHLKSRLGLHGVKAGLLHELLPKEVFTKPATLAASIKALPVQLTAARPLAEAISSAGGVRFAALDAAQMVRERPGVFCAGEMLDWEAPTGGYLLNGCLASGVAAGTGVRQWWAGRAAPVRA